MIGFSEELKFPSGVTYQQKELSSAMDPNNLAICAVDVRNGLILDDLLCRAFVVQKLFVNLIDVEPCTPGDSFNYQGPARLKKGPDGELVFAFDGEVFIPYPKGFLFPEPNDDGKPGFKVVRESRLDPFLRVYASSRPSTHGSLGSGGKAEAPKWVQAISSIGHKYCYRFNVDFESSKIFFEYKKEHQVGGGSFRLESVSWLSGTSSPNAKLAAGHVDTVSFSGFGVWKDMDGDSGKRSQVSVHISQSTDEPYVGIMVDGGVTSNVNAKPEKIEDSIPVLI
jgi:hypothetical protein